MRTTHPSDQDDRGPWGDAARHLDTEALQRGLAMLDAPKDSGELELIVARGDGGERSTPERVRVTPECGVSGDSWHRKSPEKVAAQIAVMRADVARLLANGQPLTLFGDNLLVNLDLSVANLPTGSQIRLRDAVLEVTPEPHNGCRKFRQRFGADALRLTEAPAQRGMRLRGIYVRVVEPGEIQVDDSLAVARRGPIATAPEQDTIR